MTCDRVEAGATILDHVFTVKLHIVDRQHYLRKKFHLQEYLAISLKKIQVLPINPNLIIKKEEKKNET